MGLGKGNQNNYLVIWYDSSLWDSILN